ncbi:MAG: glycosyltransferase family 4 protein [Geobacteraceae bacterium]|nr:glycosyltransferase family 4 protein [Geobacteraceae bacterium]
MRVALNAVSFAPGTIGGMETYFRSLISAFASLPGDDCYQLFGDNRYLSGLMPDDARFEVKACNGFAPRSTGWLARGIIRNLTGLDLAARCMGRIRADLVHHPFSLLTPGAACPSVVTIHDLQHEFFPEFFSPWVVRKKRREYRRAAEGAAGIITISNHVRRTLLECYGLPSEKVTTVYLASSPLFSRQGDPEQDRLQLRRYGVERPFIFYPAATWPHKNHATLLAAFRLLRDATGFDGDLVLSGIAKQGHTTVQQEIERLKLADCVRMIGYFPMQDLPAFYRRAELLAFPSLFEGFGLPLLEAMACGCPVVCADATSLPEIAGGAALLFPPRDAAALALQMQRVLEDSSLRSSLHQAGLERAACFSWQRTARETLALYHAVLEEPS